MFRRIPWLLLFLVASLIVVGVTFIYSGTAGTRLDSLARRQVFAALIASPLFFGMAAVTPSVLCRRAWWAYGGMLLALTAVFFVGYEINNARRWFQGPGGYLIQPSELAKPVFVLILARLLAGADARRLSTLLVVALLTLPPFLLIRAEPDLGTALMFLPIAAGMTYAAGGRRTWYVLLLVVGLAGASALYHSPILTDYQKERVRTFLVSIPNETTKALELRRAGDAEEARLVEQQIREIKRNAGYQSHTAQTSIGSGGWWGKGLGEGPQNRLRFLPERHGDFIFSVIAEETGWVGCVGLLSAYFLMGVVMLQIGAATRDPFGLLVCVGAATSLVSQAFANVAINTGLLPITGMPLPFVSQGGSSMMSSLALLGMVVGVSRSRHYDRPFGYVTGPVPDPFGFRLVEASRKRLPFR